jgi:hypothetical protein
VLVVEVRDGNALARAGAWPARARSCRAARIVVGCRLRGGADSITRSASSDSLSASAICPYSGEIFAASTSANRR